MLRKVIYDELLNACQILNSIEQQFFELTNSLLDLNIDYEIKKAEIINSGKIDGKNEQRQLAQQILYTKEEYINCKSTEMELNNLKAKYLAAKRNFEMWKSMMNSLND